MNLRDLLALAIKVAGLVLIVLLLSKLPEYLKGYLVLEKMTGESGLWVYLVPLMIPLSLAVLFLTFPYSISDRLVTRKTSFSSAKLRDVEVLAIRLLGLILLYFAISDLAYHMSSLMLTNSDAGQEMGVVPYDLSYLVATVVEMVFSLVLLLGAKSVQALLHRLER